MESAVIVPAVLTVASAVAPVPASTRPAPEPAAAAVAGGRAAELDVANVGDVF